MQPNCGPNEIDFLLIRTAPHPSARVHACITAPFQGVAMNKKFLTRFDVDLLGQRCRVDAHHHPCSIFRPRRGKEIKWTSCLLATSNPCLISDLPRAPPLTRPPPALHELRADYPDLVSHINCSPGLLSFSELQGSFRPITLRALISNVLDTSMWRVEVFKFYLFAKSWLEN